MRPPSIELPLRHWRPPLPVPWARSTSSPGVEAPRLARTELPRLVEVQSRPWGWREVDGDGVAQDERWALGNVPPRVALGVQVIKQGAVFPRLLRPASKHTGLQEGPSRSGAPLRRVQGAGPGAIPSRRG